MCVCVSVCVCSCCAAHVHDDVYVLLVYVDVVVCARVSCFVRECVDICRCVCVYVLCICVCMYVCVCASVCIISLIKTFVCFFCCSINTHTDMSTEHKYSSNQLHILTLPPSVYARCVHMYPTDDTTSAILLTGLSTGHVCIDRTPLSHTHPIQFELLERFHAHSDGISALHKHPTKSLFVSGSSDKYIKIEYQRGDDSTAC